MCSQRARSDPAAWSHQALPFTQCEIAETLSLHPEHSAISFCFKKAEERGNAPGSEEGRGALKPCDNNKHECNSVSYCSEKWKTFASDEHLERKEDSADWKTDGEKLEKEEGNAFTPRINDAQPSPASVTCLGSQLRPENAQVMMQRANFALGGNTATQATNAGEEMEHSLEEKMDTRHLCPTLHLIEKQHGADIREPFVENNDSADSGKDESVPPEDTHQSQHIGEYVLYVCKCLEYFVLPCDSFIFGITPAVQVLCLET